MENKKDKEEYKKIIYVTKEQLEKGIVFGPEDTNIKIVIVDYDKNISKYVKKNIMRRAIIIITFKIHLVLFFR